MKEVIIRPLSPSDDIDAITELLHRAYRRNAEQNLHFVATHQDSTVTKERLARGATFVAESEGQIVGTITVSWVTEPMGEFQPTIPTMSFNQFAVDPSRQGEKIGDRLLNQAEEQARTMGVQQICCDTAQPASGLIRYYQSHGYEVVGEVDWRPHVNYLSYVLVKAL
ncbi:MAG TPA: GNAT family N-acetyltransferase [Fimbriimonas sp.]|nr:GNAT family N-acetyltransferase [Fimbriimonas sp.]